MDETIKINETETGDIEIEIDKPDGEVSTATIHPTAPVAKPAPPAIGSIHGAPQK